MVLASLIRKVKDQILHFFASLILKENLEAPFKRMSNACQRKKGPHLLKQNLWSPSVAQW